MNKHKNPFDKDAKKFVKLLQIKVLGKRLAMCRVLKAASISASTWGQWLNATYLKGTATAPNDSQKTRLTAAVKAFPKQKWQAIGRPNKATLKAECNRRANENKAAREAVALAANL